MIPILHAAFVLFLLVGFPLWDRRETARLKALPSPATRIRSYRKTIAWLWLATVFVVVTTPWAALLTPPPATWVPASLRGGLGWGLLASLSAGILGPALLASRSPKFLDAHLRQLGPLAFFLPQSATERAWFAAVSVSAGVCEELIFRGFLIQYFAHPPLHFPAWLAVVAAAVVFGVDHGYQGVGGILTTMVLALIFALLFILTGHLWVVMVLHATIDLRIVWLLWLGRAQWPPGRGTS